MGEELAAAETGVEVQDGKILLVSPLQGMLEVTPEVQRIFTAMSAPSLAVAAGVAGGGGAEGVKMLRQPLGSACTYRMYVKYKYRIVEERRVR